jgi:hypothetical protein
MGSVSLAVNVVDSLACPRVFSIKNSVMTRTFSHDRARYPKKPKISPPPTSATSPQISDSPTVWPTIRGVITKPLRVWTAVEPQGRRSKTQME